MLHCAVVAAVAVPGELDEPRLEALRQVVVTREHLLGAQPHHGVEPHPSEVTVHEQPAPAIGERVVELTRQRTECAIGVLDEPGPCGQSKRRRLPTGREEPGGILEEHPPSFGLGQLSDRALVVGPEPQPYLDPLHRDPRRGSRRDVRRSSSSIERAGGGSNTAASSSTRPSPSASRSRFTSVILPLVSKR